MDSLEDFEYTFKVKRHFRAKCLNDAPPPMQYMDIVQPLVTL